MNIKTYLIIRNTIQTTCFILFAIGIWELINENWNDAIWILALFLIGATWDTIADSEVDANSPLNTTLFSKIQGNLKSLANEGVVWSAFKGECYLQATTEEVIVSADLVSSGTKTTVLETKIYIPEWVDQLQINWHHTFDAGATPNEVLCRIDTDGTGTTWNTGDAETAPVGVFDASSYDASVLPSAGSFVGPGGIRTIQVRAEQTSGSNKTYFLRGLIVRGRAIVA